ncbi:hypothetical protein [Paenibacillus sp. 2TAB19]|uniref:hypothetical protein n=1 Tax=Paenibacillus sp. 2TAB19 TaxID=3233003 RepID=UPI003F99A76D
MIIVHRENDVVFASALTVEIIEQGILAEKGTIRACIYPETAFTYFDVTTPSDWEPQKFCYTEVDGFTLNASYVPPQPPPEVRIAQLEAENALMALELIDTQIALEQSQTEQANLILTLVERGVI